MNGHNLTDVLLGTRSRRLILDCIFLGIVGAAGAQLFALMLGVANSLFLNHLAGFYPPGLPANGGGTAQWAGPYGLWLVPLVTTLGGLITGLLVYSVAPEAEGHGTDTAVKSFHRSGGRIRARVPLVKMVASAITIGSGGAAGREGPTALISAGIGSVYASFTRRADDERRILVLMGMAAGLSAIFRSPIGSAIFAIEVLYGQMELEAGALLYTMLSSIVAYALNGMLVGWKPLFEIPSFLGASVHQDYVWYGVLGLVSGVVATLLPIVFYTLRDAFGRLPISVKLKPAVGGFALGCLGLVVPQVLGGGYGWIQEAINGQLAVGLLFALVLAKILALSLTVSSGGSGGVFGPSLFVGAMLGALHAQLFNLSPAAMAVVGMAAVFGAAARVPIATLLMVTEMTGGYQLLVPAALAVTLSCLTQAGLASHFKYQSLYEAQVAGRMDSPAHYREHLRGIVRLLHQGNISASPHVGLELMKLMESGVDVELPDHMRLDLLTLTRQSPWLGRPLSDFMTEKDGWRLLLLVRNGHGSTTEPNTTLAEGDRLIVCKPSEPDA